MSQLILIAAAPLVTRLYTPSEFGVFAVVVSAISIISIVSALRYEVAIPLPRSETGAANIVLVSLISLLVTCMVSFFAFWLFQHAVIKALDLPDYPEYLLLILLGAVLSSLYLILYYVAVRRQKYTSIARTRVYQSMFTVLCQTSSSTLGALGLLLGQYSGQLVGIASLVKNSKIEKILNSWSVKRAKVVAVRYKEFPLYSTLGALANTASTQLPTILLLIFYSSSVVGVYALSFRVLGTPLTVLSDAIGSVFYASAVQANREGRLKPLVEKIQTLLFRLFAPAFLLAAIYSEDFFSFVFGAEWADAGKMAAVMMPWFMLQLIASPLSYVFAVKNKESITAVVQYTQLIVRIAVLVVSALYLEPLAAISVYALVSFLFYMIYMAVINKLSSVSMFFYLTENRWLVLFVAIIIILAWVSSYSEFLSGYYKFILSIPILGYYIFLSFDPIRRRAMWGELRDPK